MKFNKIIDDLWNIENIEVKLGDKDIYLLLMSSLPRFLDILRMHFLLASWWWTIF